MRLLLRALASALLCAHAHAAVVRPAPNFTFPGPGKTLSLKGLRGQAVVLVIADSPRLRPFRKQLERLEEIYSQFASKQVLFVAALREGAGPIRSNIPFAVANKGPQVAESFGVEEKFQLVIIGKDGNIDYQTDTVCTGQRVADVIQNSFAVQARTRKP
ncbi:MAG: peroxiredoxin family protein [Verrucomicrobiota bacterium]|nr:peroxiredoxin family protein [Verrucomicrobiota bacterium]